MANKKKFAAPAVKGKYKPYAKTARFDIFKHEVVRNPKLGHGRLLFTAWPRNVDIPRPVCEVVLWPHPHGCFVEWVHVCSEWRRQGIATEVLSVLAAKNRYGYLTLFGATEDGAAFVAASATKINNPRPAKPIKAKTRSRR